MGGVTTVPEFANHLKSIFRKRGKVQDDNFIFRLLTRFTPLILLLLAGLIFYQRIVNEHINCLGPPDEDLRMSAVNQYCFVTGTYTVTNYSTRLEKLGKHLPYPGVGPSHSPSSSSSETKIKFHLYFQWVPYILAIQAMLLTMPQFIWKSLHKNRVKHYCTNIVEKSLAADKDNNVSNENGLHSPSKRFVNNIKYHKTYSYGFFFCEWLNLWCVVLVWLLNDQLLAGDFENFGSQWISYISRNDLVPEESQAKKLNGPWGQFNRNHPFDIVFPKMSKCEFNKFGPGGSIQNHDILCVLALNVIHEKVFLFLWFWLVFLLVAQIVMILYRVALFLSKSFRYKLIEGRIEPTFITDEFKQYANSVMEYRHNVEDSTLIRKEGKALFNQLNFSDWFVLWRIANNSDRRKFTIFLQEVIAYKSDLECEKSRECRKYKLGEEGMGMAGRRGTSENHNRFIPHNSSTLQKPGEGKSLSARNRNLSHGSQLGSVYDQVNQSLLEIREEENQVKPEHQNHKYYKSNQPSVSAPDGSNYYASTNTINENNQNAHGAGNKDFGQNEFDRKNSLD